MLARKFKGKQVNSYIVDSFRHKLRSTLVQVVIYASSCFECAHYIFTPHDLTKWTQSLLHYGLQESTEETSQLEVLAYEANDSSGTTL